MNEWHIKWVERTGSTNADLAELARDGAPERTVVATDHQDAGRGRLGRSWHTPAGLALTSSFLLRPTDVPASRWSWLPLLTGVAVVDAVAAAGVDAMLKWPNDVMIGERKLAGILVERVETPIGAAAVVGVGLNVSQRVGDLPDNATSLALAGAPVTREAVLDAVVEHLNSAYSQWRTAGGDSRAGLAAAYLKRCSTVGRMVTAALPGDGALRGRAVDIDGAGRLVVEPDRGGERVSIGAGDIVHLRVFP